MADVDTPYDKINGIVIRTDPAKNPTFHLTVKEQLDLLYTKPVGKKLLDEIGASKVAGFKGAKVAIMRASDKVDMTDNVAKWHQGNTTYGIDMSKAKPDKGKNGVGTPSIIKYNPNIFKNPDGERPPFIGLAHELIHAHHNLYGITGSPTANDESEVVGFKKNKDLPITENKIRAEHKVGPRKTYKDVVPPDQDDH